MIYKIEGRIVGLSTVYYEIYQKSWFGWRDIGGCFDSIEEAEAAVYKLIKSKIIEVPE